MSGVVNQNDSAHCMIIVHSGLSLLQTIEATCFEDTKDILEYAFQLYQIRIVELFLTLLVLPTLQQHYYWPLNFSMASIPFESKCSMILSYIVEYFNHNPL